MCSTHPQRITEIGKAIDDLAAEALAAYAPAEGANRGPGADAGPEADHRPASASPGSPRQANDLADVSDTDQVVIRLAQLWALLAELDPEVARRLPRYQA
jgi:hypothetical protein